MSVSLPLIESRPMRLVPCGTCTECCHGDAIFMHPECGDVPANYETDSYEGRLILKHKPNGDCIYLDRSAGCTIHSRRPVICREMDCRILVRQLGANKMKMSGMGHIVYAARRLEKNGVGSCAT